MARKLNIPLIFMSLMFLASCYDYKSEEKLHEDSQLIPASKFKPLEGKIFVHKADEGGTPKFIEFELISPSGIDVIFYGDSRTSKQELDGAYPKDKMRIRDIIQAPLGDGTTVYYGVSKIEDSWHYTPFVFKGGSAENLYLHIFGFNDKEVKSFDQMVSSTREYLSKQERVKAFMLIPDMVDARRYIEIEHELHHNNAELAKIRDRELEMTEQGHFGETNIGDFDESDAKALRDFHERKTPIYLINNYKERCMKMQPTYGEGHRFLSVSGRVEIVVEDHYITRIAKEITEYETRAGLGNRCASSTTDYHTFSQSIRSDLEIPVVWATKQHSDVCHRARVDSWCNRQCLTTTPKGSELLIIMLSEKLAADTVGKQCIN